MKPLLIALALAGPAAAQPEPAVSSPTITLAQVAQAVGGGAAAGAKRWFETLSIRGYAQFRYNRLLESNRLLECEQCDKSMAGNKGFFLRRARMIFYGDISDQVYLYIQPDFASDASATSQHFAQLRDWYFDVAFDKAKEHRIRFGQSKVPYGFENLQSSQNRLALDRADPLNSAVSNERDIGAFYMWAPSPIRKRFSELVSSGLKGSGDYGVVAFGAFNGQTANRPEANNSLHMVARVSYPFKTAGGQFIEPGVQAYTGRHVVANRTAGVRGGSEVIDRRVAASLVIYPQPLGFQAEGTIGEGPEYDAPANQLRKAPLAGGYVQTMYMLKTHGHTITPFVRAQHYRGGKKHEQDARRYVVRELEMGAEWQPSKALELVAMYVISDRAYEDRATRGNRQKGERLRLQLQVNF